MVLLKLLAVCVTCDCNAVIDLYGEFAVSVVFKLLTTLLMLLAFCEICDCNDEFSLSCDDLFADTVALIVSAF